jgi:hypothetical protein
MAKSEEVKPCKKCGGEGEGLADSYHGWLYHWIECTSCHYQTDDEPTRERAIESWNRRAAEGERNGEE